MLESDSSRKARTYGTAVPAVTQMCATPSLHFRKTVILVGMYTVICKYLPYQ